MKIPTGHKSVLSGILQENGWLWAGTRFVSPDSCDIGNVALFVNPDTAEGYANHLRLMGVASGIKSRQVPWSVQKAAKYPPIADIKTKQRKATDVREARRHNRPALSLSAQREFDRQKAS